MEVQDRLTHTIMQLTRSELGKELPEHQHKSNGPLHWLTRKRKMNSPKKTGIPHLIGLNLFEWTATNTCVPKLLRLKPPTQHHKNSIYNRQYIRELIIIRTSRITPINSKPFFYSNHLGQDNQLEKNMSLWFLPFLYTPGRVYTAKGNWPPAFLSVPA